MAIDHRESNLGFAGFLLLAAAALIAAAMMPRSAAAAPLEQTLYSFCAQSGCADGSFPYAGLIFDAAGNLYGTTSQGGTAGKGTVFELTPDGTETVLYSFKGGSDGANPYAGLILDASGALY